MRAVALRIQTMPYLITQKFQPELENRSPIRSDARLPLLWYRPNLPPESKPLCLSGCQDALQMH